MTDEVEETIGFGDAAGVRAEISTMPADEDGPGSVHFGLGVTGAASIRGMPSPKAARQIAAAVLDAADKAEA